MDIMLISETKLDAIPTTRFTVDGFRNPYRLDRAGYGGGLMLYVNENIPSKQNIQNRRDDILLVFTTHLLKTFLITTNVTLVHTG